MPAIQLRLGAFSAALAILAATSSGALAQKKYDTGATDTEIKIGNIMPYSGPASAYGVIGKTEEAYFKKINAEGGINGRKINFISYDDGYSPPKTVEQARKLVESDEVLLIFNSLGTPPNSAIQKYMNTKKVPQLFVATGATKWNDPKDFPWTMGWQPSYQSETQIYAKYILKNKPDAKIARALSERRLRQGLSQGPEGRSRRQGRLDDRRRGQLRDHRAHHRLAHRQAEGRAAPTSSSTSRFRNSPRRRSRRSPRSTGSRFTSSTTSRASIGAMIKPAGFDDAQGIISSAYHQGSDRSAVEGRSGHEDLQRLPRQILSRKPTGPTLR